MPDAERLEVTGCLSSRGDSYACPFHWDQFDHCQHPSIIGWSPTDGDTRPIPDDIEVDQHPSWCPLRERDMLVSLRVA